MTPETQNPALRAQHRVPEIDLAGRLIDRDNTPTHRSLQLWKLVSRFGLSPAHAALIASLAFGEGRNG